LKGKRSAGAVLRSVAPGTPTEHASVAVLTENRQADQERVAFVTIDADILVALQGVVDPELGINIVDIGLVYRAVWTTAGIVVALTLTTPSCPFGEMIVDEARKALRSHFPETPSIHVELVWDPPWSLAQLSDEAQRKLGWSKFTRRILDA
jgi:metal-sulfur cluster biosynthetic enzyme